MSVMMIALSGCQTSAKTGGFTSYDEHYQKNETTLKEDALSDRWESRGSKVAVVSKEKADNNDYPEAKEVLLVNNTKNKVIVSQKVFDQAYPASTTKIMTALVALENADLSDVVTVSQNADMNSFAADEATCGIKAGDKITLSDLLYGLLLHSGNDNATAIAEYVGGSMDGFAEMMNKEAAKLMATGTHFVNSNGLHNDNHYTTAYDLYLIFNECIKHDDFVKIIMEKSHTAKITGNDGTVRSITWEPTNFYATGDAKKPDNVTVIGGKTGTTQLAGNCLILLTKDKNDHPYISIVMKADTKPLLYKDMTAIVEAIPENN